MPTLLTILTDPARTELYVDPEELAAAQREAEKAGAAYRISPL